MFSVMQPIEISGISGLIVDQLPLQTEHRTRANRGFQEHEFDT
jgi:hypothetical protein